MVFGGQFMDPKLIVKTVSDKKGAFTVANQPIEIQGLPTIREPHTPWSKPPSGIIKVNWDAAVDGKQKRIGIRVVARNHDGRVLAMMSKIMEYIQDLVTAKALASRRAIKFNHSLGISRIILEGDTIQIVKALNGGRCSYRLI